MSEQARVSTSKQVGQLSQEEFVLYRGRMLITADNSAFTGPYFAGSGSFDIEFLNLNNIVPSVEVVFVIGEDLDADNQFTQAPYYSYVLGYDPIQSVDYLIDYGTSKTTGRNARLVINVLSDTQNQIFQCFFTIKKTKSASIDGNDFPIVFDDTP